MRTTEDRLDDSQLRAVRQRVPVLQVLGAPGTGKTRVAVATVLDRVVRDGLAPDAALVLAPTRVAAGRLRDQITAAVSGTTTQPLARTPSAFAFQVLSDAAAHDHAPPPRLLTGAEQDVVLGDLLAGHRESGTGPAWPPGLRGALHARGFRDQLRDLLMRTVENGLGPEELATLGQQHDRPEWVAAAELLREYDEVTALQGPGSFDPAWICTAAADRLATDESLLQRVRQRVQLIVVDDAQELTASAARLVEQMADSALPVVLIGDGDVASQGFRGADPARFTRLAQRLAERAGANPGRAVLHRSHRQGAILAEATGRVVDRLGASTGVEHRHPQPVEPPVDRAGGEGALEVVTVRTTAQEAALVARRFRAAHLGDPGVPWSRMAVLARSRSRLDQVRRALVAAGVPVHEPPVTGPLHEHPVVRALLLAYDICLRPEGQGCTAAEAVELVTSPLGGADPVAFLRLRRLLAATERQDGGARPSEEVLAALLDQPMALRLLGGDAAPAARLAQVLVAGRSAAVRDGRGWAVGVTAETVLWALWSTAGVAESWRASALAGGPAGARADRDLDAVMTLFGAAESYVDRLPGRGPDGFLSHIRALEVSPDSLVARARPTEAVEVLTPQSAVGREWDLVAVIGVQQGVWPDLRLRDTLLGAETLVSVLHGRPVDGTTGLRAAQAQVQADELRQFYAALTRCRGSLLVTAVASVEEQPSSFLDVLDPQEGDRVPIEVPPPLTLRTLIARLRADLVRAQRSGDLPARDRAAAHLLALDEAGIAGADPASWWRGRALSDDRPLQPEGPVPVSPSRVQTFSECQLRWLLSTHGGEPGGATASAVGTLVHEVIAAAPSASVEELTVALDQRWHELALGEGWVQRRQWERAVRMLARYGSYVTEATAQGRQLLGVETDISAQHDRALITGRVDRLEQDPSGNVLVIDLKTGSSKPTNKEIPRHPQLGAYQVAVGADGRPTAGAALVHLGAASGSTSEKHGVQRQPALGSDEDPQWAHDLVARTAEGMAGAQFPASPGPWCRVCPVKFSCPIQPEGRMLA